jgi:membrane protein required for colicin V production
MNLTDLLFILLLMGCLALGFFQGTIRLTIAILAFYVSILLASLYFRFLGTFFRQRLGSTQEVGEITAFAVILLLGFLLLTSAGLYTFRYAKMPASFDFIDRIIGTLLGLLLGGLLLGIFAEVLTLLFISRSPAAGVTFPLVRWMQDSIRQSFLVSFFSSNVLPLIYQMLRPILPPDANVIFRVS